MSLPPPSSSPSAPPSPTIHLASQPMATASAMATNRSEPSPHDDNTAQLERPQPPYALDSTSPPSARTSFTRVDVLGEEGTPANPRATSQVHPNPSSASLPAGASGQSAEPQAPLLEAQPESVINETDNVVPMASTSAHNGADGPPSSSSSQKLLEQPQVPQTPQAFLTFLLVSGKRRTMSFEPETTIGRVKELIWNAWPSEWQDERPPAPSYLRVLYLGKMLQDDDTLTKLKIPSSLPNSPQPTIVHLSIRPYNPSGEDGAIKKKRKGNDPVNASDDTAPNGAGCCGCIIC